MTKQEHESNTRDALCDETSPPKRARLGKKIDHGKLVSQQEQGKLEQLVHQWQINHQNRWNPQQNLQPLGLGRPQKGERQWLRMSKSFVRRLRMPKTFVRKLR